MMVRLGRSPNAIVRAPGPDTFASRIRHTPWIVCRGACALAAGVMSSPDVSTATDTLFAFITEHLARRVSHGAFGIRNQELGIQNSIPNSQFSFPDSSGFSYSGRLPMSPPTAPLPDL